MRFRLLEELKHMLRGDDQLPAKRHSLRQVETYEVECRDFNRIEQDASGIGTYFAVATACLPVAVTLTVTLKTTTVTDANAATAIWGLTWACYIVGIAFCAAAWRDRGSLRRFMQDIRDSQIAPIGAKELPLAPDLTPTADPTAPTVPAQPDIEERQ